MSDDENDNFMDGDDEDYDLVRWLTLMALLDGSRFHSKRTVYELEHGAKCDIVLAQSFHVSNYVP